MRKHRYCVAHTLTGRYVTIEEKKTLYFHNTTSVVCFIIALTATSGIGALESIAMEQIGTTTFYFFLCLLVSISGLVGCLAFIGANYVVIGCIEKLSFKLHEFFLSIASAMFGLISGVTLYVAITGDWLFLKGLIALVVIYAQTDLSTRWLNQSFHFAGDIGGSKVKGDKVFLGVHLVFLALGLFGIVDIVI